LGVLTWEPAFPFPDLLVVMAPGVTDWAFHVGLNHIPKGGQDKDDEPVNCHKRRSFGLGKVRQQATYGWYCRDKTKKPWGVRVGA
jgi:hypothetical protein